MPEATIAGATISGEGTVDEARAALDEAIERGEYRSLFDVILGGLRDGVERALRVRISMITAALLFGLIALAASAALAATFGRGADWISDVGRHAGSIGIGVCSAIACLKITRTLRDLVRDTILDALDRAEDIASVRERLASIFDPRRQLYFALALAPVMGAPLLWALHLHGEPTERMPEHAVSTMVNGFLISAALYYPYRALPFFERMGRFHFRLYRAAPSSSQVLDELSDASVSTLYVLCAFFAAVTFVSARMGLVAGIPGLVCLIISSWVPLLLVFAGAQRTFSRIIEGAKWRSMRAIQDQVHTLSDREPILQPATLEHIGKLMDHHDRIQKTRDTAIDLQAWVAFLNSMLLPAIAFVAAHAEEALAWLKK